MREVRANRNASPASPNQACFSLIMLKFMRLFLLLALVGTIRAERDIGYVDITADKAIAVRVSGNTPELNALAQQAFAAHGCYKVVSGGPAAYDIKFSLGSPTQVRVDITKGAAGAAFASEVVNGTNARNALLRAADFAVEKT